MNRRCLIILAICCILTVGLHAQALKVVYLPDSIPLRFIRIPAGNFTMGSQADDPHAQGDEFPARPVRISRDFYLGQFELTQRQWRAIMGYNPSTFQDPDRPVEMISWNDARACIAKLNRLGIGRFRMPTEAEWEYAGRLEAYTYRNEAREVVPWQMRRYAWFHSESEGKSHPVGQKQAGDLRLYDMMGNLWEWVSDWYGDYPDTSQIDPQGPASGTKKVYRGGSWFNEPEALRIPNRNAHPPDLVFTNAGLRLVLETE